MGYIWYWLSTKAYFILVHLLAPFNRRAKLLSKAQKNALTALKQTTFSNTDFVVWFHVSSLGEFEQGKPIMLALKNAKPNLKLVVSFFSPSGYSAAEKDPIIDKILYLPFESKKNAETFIQCIKPSLAIWVKYDFWHEYLSALKQNSIPVFLVSAQFRPNQIFFKKWAFFQRSTLQLFTHIFCQNQSSLQLLKSFGLNQCSVSGDNRYDRVKEYANKLEEIPFIDAFIESKPCLILGSSYAVEEDMLLHCLPQLSNVKIIIAPHFVDENRLQEIESKFGASCVRFKQLNEQTLYNNYSVLLIDRIGLLARLYRYGTLALVGGGFWENGLHNSLEHC
ncbi:MAG: 3-deoxy-D-manno-octulosonic acid transferase, partial [Bacteroidia bacterium]|nr:3-deoxy-D-manno-octulosonic acid transferase [Bacteroidia bacterium]